MPDVEVAGEILGARETTRHVAGRRKRMTGVGIFFGGGGDEDVPSTCPLRVLGCVHTGRSSLHLPVHPAVLRRPRPGHGATGSLSRQPAQGRRAGPRRIRPVPRTLQPDGGLTGTERGWGDNGLIISECLLRTSTYAHITNFRLAERRLVRW